MVYRLKKGTLFCLKGFIREPKAPKKGIRVLLGILGGLVDRSRHLREQANRYGDSWVCRACRGYRRSQGL